jgi:hypothetical protein
MDGQIWYDDHGNFKALKKGPIDPKLLEKTRKWGKIKAELTPLHIYMREQLRSVSIDVPLDDLPVYFQAFLKHRDDSLDMFFSVDGFSGRVHTPVVNLKGHLRQSLKINRSALCSLDVKQMQPTILAKLLEEHVGKNSFSSSVFKGDDVYLTLLHQNHSLKTRDEAKKFLYQLIFGQPLDDIAQLFKGDVTWVKWINNYKTQHEERNPHARDTHTNLAWLLQTSEVEIMQKVWQKLMDKRLPFLTIHDDILVRRKDKNLVYQIFHQELSKEFRFFEITVQCY